MSKHDYKGVRAYQREELPLGNHNMVILDVEEATSKNGNEMFKVSVAIDDDELNKRGTYLVTMLPPDHKAAGMALHFLKTIGEPFEGEFETTTANWVGKRFNAVVKERTYNGMTQAGIVAVYPVSDGQLKSARVRPKPTADETSVPF